MKLMFWPMRGRWWGVKELGKMRFSYRNGWQDVAFFIITTYKVIYAYLKRIGWKNVQFVNMVNLPTMCKTLLGTIDGKESAIVSTQALHHPCFFRD